MGVHNSRMVSRDAALRFELTQAPPEFIDHPYPWYAALRQHDPVHAMRGGGVFLSRYDDALAVYREPRASSDKKIEFMPKFGDSPLYEHHTTSLVFSDPPLHTRLRRLIMGALNQRAIARMEGRIAFSRLLARFPKIDLAGQPERDRRIRFRGFRKLPVRVAST